jgi:hypothetical protein
LLQDAIERAWTCDQLDLWFPIEPIAIRRRRDPRGATMILWRGSHTRPRGGALPMAALAIHHATAFAYSQFTHPSIEDLNHTDFCQLIALPPESTAERGGIFAK